MRYWDYSTIQHVWLKASLIPGYEHLSHLWRVDAYGNRIYRWAYGDYSSRFGWEIDHWIPTAWGGTDDLWNLRPLQCSTNRSRQDRLRLDESPWGQYLYGSKSIWWE